MEQPSSSLPPRVSRRTALKVGLASIVGAAIGAGVGGGAAAIVSRLSERTTRKFHFFTGSEAALLTAICEQIIPGDDAPGATQTGAIDFIDLQLVGVYRRHQQTYRRGLESFRRTCEQEHGGAFESLPAETRIEALRAIESGRAPKEFWGDPSPRAFFNLVVDHTMQSFYGSPRHGGNRDYASYRMLGLDYPPVVGRNRPRKG